eukprot:snap_masked-scaffold_6-processed-gene-19.8-mRNA-1 protein AED:1.00 eAED:1.00 QI:0/0/0/0/1/1/2/0/242
MICAEEKARDIYPTENMIRNYSETKHNFMESFWQYFESIFQTTTLHPVPNRHEAIALADKLSPEDYIHFSINNLERLIQANDTDTAGVILDELNRINCGEKNQNVEKAFQNLQNKLVNILESIQMSNFSKEVESALVRKFCDLDLLESFPGTIAENYAKSGREDIIKLLQKYSLCTTETSDLLEETLGRGKCVVCLDKEVEVKFIPCNHSKCCKVCADDLRRRRNMSCPICRQSFTSFRVFK